MHSKSPTVIELRNQKSRLQIQDRTPNLKPNTPMYSNGKKKDVYMTLSNFIRLPNRLFRAKVSPIEPNKPTEPESHKVTVNLPIPKLVVELHPPLAYVLELIMASKCQGIRRPDPVDVGLNEFQWGMCIRFLRAEGALIESKMKEGRTKKGHMSSKIIHYTYRGWK